MADEDELTGDESRQFVNHENAIGRVVIDHGSSGTQNPDVRSRVADAILLHAQTIMTSPTEWQNTGTFGPEQASLDVAYATALPPDAALAWVEARLAEVQSHFANLGTKRNNLFPVYHLPKVVLFQILSWVALSRASPESEESAYSYGSHTDQTKDLIHLSQACKLFRGAALERSELWVRVNLEYPAHAKLFLERSGDKLVTVFLHPHARDPTPLKSIPLEILQPHLGRITNLDLTFASETQLGCASKNPLAMDMPALRMLQLHDARNERRGHFGGTSNSDPPANPPFVFPTLNGPYPELRKVTLASINVPWDSTLFNGLTELDLSHQGSGHAPTIEEFVTVLGQCAGLEKLHLCSSGPKELPNPPAAPDVKKVRLPHLRDLSIIHNQHRYTDIPLLLSRVSIPPSTGIHIQCNEAVDPIICFSRMFPPEHPFLEELPKYGTLKHLHSFTFFHFRLIDEPSGGFLSFRVNRHDQTVQVGSSITDFFRTFGEPVNSTEIYPSKESNPWADILESLPNVESLKFKRELDYPDFAVALSTTVCPRLKKLSCEYDVHTAAHQSAWLTVVKARAENGLRLEEFGLSISRGAELLTDELVDEVKLYTDRFWQSKSRT